MKIQQKLTLLLLFIGLIPTLVVSTVAYINISQQLTHKTEDQIASIAIKQEQKVNSLLQGKQEEALKLANRYDLQLAMGDHLSGAHKSVDDIKAVLRARKTEASSIQSINVSNRENIIIASTNTGEEGQKISVSNYYTKAGQENSVTVREDPRDGIDKLYVATRLSVNQKDIGLLTLIYGIDDIVGAIQDHTGLGATGETVIVSKDENNNAISLFPLRFNTDAALSTQLNKLQLFDNIDSTYKGVTDYRDHPVMVSARMLGFADWAIATKIDNEEAFAPIAELRNALLLIVIGSSVTIIIIALSFTRYFTAPIIALTEKTRSIREGDFTQRIAVGSSDEIGALASAFNEMTEGLQISSRKLGEEHARLQASINGLDIGFLMTTKTGQIVSCNPALLQMLKLGKTESKSSATLSLEVVQKQIKDFDLVSAINTCLESGKPFEAAEVGYGARFLSFLGAPIRLEHGEVIGSVMVVEDITEEKILARSKDEFFSIASHELRTPLTAIRGNTRMILDYYPELLKDVSVNELLSDIHESSVRLIDIVNDFLDVSRIEQGKITFKYEAFSIENIVESVVTDMKSVLEEKNIYLKYDEKAFQSMPLVWADSDRTRQIAYNLIGNAAKFTEQGGITLGASLDKKLLKISVVDTGRGIPLDKQELLFRKFQQAGDSLITRDTTKGTGLGLYISKMLVERMGGMVRLEKSEEGKGTTFSFTLPVATAEQQKKPEVTTEGDATN